MVLNLVAGNEMTRHLTGPACRRCVQDPAQPLRSRDDLHLVESPIEGMPRYGNPTQT